VEVSGVKIVRGHLRLVRSGLPPVQCAWWCRDGSGHGGVRFRGDQSCMSEPVVVDAGPDAEVGVHVRQAPGGGPVVYLDIEAECREAELDPARARRVVRALLDAAELVDGAASHPRGGVLEG
jgi:hypothetical protein